MIRKLSTANATAKATAGQPNAAEQKPTVTAPVVAPAEKIQDAKPASVEQPVTEKKVADEAIDLTREEFVKLIRSSIHEELLAAGLIKPVEEAEVKPDDKPVEDTNDAIEAIKEEETEIAEKSDDKEVEEVEEKVEDASSDELAKMLADPKKKEAIQALLKDSAIPKKAADKAAANFTTRYDDSITVNDKSEQSDKRPNRYE